MSNSSSRTAERNAEQADKASQTDAAERADSSVDQSVGNQLLSTPEEPADSSPADGEPATEAVEQTSPPSRRDHVIVVGYDNWTSPVIDELERIGCSVSLLVTDETAAARFIDRDCTVVVAEEFNESAFTDAGIDRAAAVLIATLNDQANVLSVLTVRNIDESIRVVSFAGEAKDVPKLERAGADTVISLGRVVGELLVDVAVDGRAVDEVVGELVEAVR